MYLNLEQMREITRGVTHVELIDGAFRFYRFTEAQTEVLRHAAELDPQKKNFYDKTYATSGVRLAFRTDSSRIGFDFEIFPGGSSRLYAGFDLYQDGLMTEHCNVDYQHVSGGHINFALSAGEKTVELYLPWSVVVALKNVELDDGAAVVGVSRKLKMICFGDSITHGYDASFPSQSYACRIARLLDADETNKGLGGDIFNPPLAELPDPTAPYIVTVAYGTNDWSKCTPEVFFENAKAFYSRLSALYPNAKILGISPICRLSGNRSNTPFGSPCVNVDAVIRKACQGLSNVTLINGWKLTPAVKDFYADQWLHPNDLGFGVYASNLYREIAKHI